MTRKAIKEAGVGCRQTRQQKQQLKEGAAAASVVELLLRPGSSSSSASCGAEEDGIVWSVLRDHAQQGKAIELQVCVCVTDWNCRAGGL